MASFTHFLRGILIPLFTALILYLAATLVILPFIRRHRTRYSQYLPMPTAMASNAASWRTNLSDALYALFVPSTWSRQPPVHVHDVDDDDSDFDDDEGEGMVGFDPVDDRRREALDQRRSMVDDERRLGRDLEQGFKDDSDDEDVDETRRSLSRSRSRS